MESLVHIEGTVVPPKTVMNSNVLEAMDKSSLMNTDNLLTEKLILENCCEVPSLLEDMITKVTNYQKEMLINVDNTTNNLNDSDVSTIDDKVTILLHTADTSKRYLNEMSLDLKTGDQSNKKDSITTLSMAKTTEYREEEVYTDDSDASSDDSFSLDSSSSDLSDSFYEKMPKKSTFNKPICIKTKGELGLDDLPPIQYLSLSLNENEVQKIGHIYAIVEKLAIVQSIPDLKPLDMESVLFLSPDKTLGRIFDVFGPVTQPFYSIRFNTMEDIKSKQMAVDDDVFYAPEKSDITSYVFVDQLRQLKGSDASWKDNNEPPEEFVEYSDDEAEKAAKHKRRAKNRPHNVFTPEVENKRPAVQPSSLINPPEALRAPRQTNLYPSPQMSFQMCFGRPTTHNYRSALHSNLNGTQPVSLQPIAIIPPQNRFPISIFPPQLMSPIVNGQSHVFGQLTPIGHNLMQTRMPQTRPMVFSQPPGPFSNQVLGLPRMYNPSFVTPKSFGTSQSVMINHSLAQVQERSSGVPLTNSNQSLLGQSFNQNSFAGTQMSMMGQNQVRSDSVSLVNPQQPLLGQCFNKNPFGARSNSIMTVQNLIHQAGNSPVPLTNNHPQSYRQSVMNSNSFGTPQSSMIGHNLVHQAGNGAVPNNLPQPHGQSLMNSNSFGAPQTSMCGQILNQGIPSSAQSFIGQSFQLPPSSMSQPSYKAPVSFAGSSLLGNPPLGMTQLSTANQYNPASSPVIVNLNLPSSSVGYLQPNNLVSTAWSNVSSGNHSWLQSGQIPPPQRPTITPSPQGVANNRVSSSPRYGVFGFQHRM